MIGETISHYRIIKKIGKGGMGVVYKAEDLKLNRAVALKFLPVHLVKDAETKTRFIHEAKATAAFQHPNVTVIYDFIESGDETVIVMEYLEGETLAQKIKSQDADLKQILDWVTGIAEGLAVAQRKGITHRDIKPENIMITSSGVVKIMDFGVAKLRGTPTMTEPGTRIGTVDYAAPELVMGDKSDHRSDIFSLGVVLYELLTGQRPFRGDHDAAVIYSIVNEIPVPPTQIREDIPPILDSIVLKMLEKKKDKRFQSYDEFLANLHAIYRNIDAISIRNKTAEKGKQQKLNVRLYKKQFSSIKIKRNRYYIYSGILVILIFLFWAWLHWFPSSDNVIDSIAVLPLENLSENPAEDYFADGMTDALISNLAMIGALNVISRTSTMTYKNTEKTLPVIAHELNVEAIVEGSVLRSGNRVRITAQLIDGRTDRHIWVRTYERDLSDILTLQGEVAHAIVREIELKITPQEHKRLTSSRQVDPEAYEAFLKGRYFWNKHSEDSFWKSIKYFEEAIEKDPTFANAYVGLAESYMGFTAPGIEVLPPDEIMPKAKSAAMHALKVDDMLAEAHAAMGCVKLTYDWDWTSAESEFKRAIELNPSYAVAHLYYSLYLTIMGRHEEAIAATKRALKLDPLSLQISVVLGNQYFHAHQYDQAIEHQLNVLKMNLNNWHAHWSLGMAYAQKGMYKESILRLEEAVTLSKRNAFVLSTLGYAYGLAGKKDDAINILDDLLELSKKRYIAPFAIAQIYIGIGNKEQAIQWLEKGAQEHSAAIAWLGVIPIVDSLRPDPRFNELLIKMGLEK